MKGIDSRKTNYMDIPSFNVVRAQVVMGHYIRLQYSVSLCAFFFSILYDIHVLQSIAAFTHTFNPDSNPIQIVCKQSNLD